jgi:hypothetical protein
LSKTTKVAILFVFFLFGCAGRGPLVVTDRPSPDVRLSPEIQLLDVPIERFSAAFDQDGRVHVLAFTSKPHELHHLVIGIEGVLSREVVTSLDSNDHLDIAFDSSGNLHAIVGEDHFVLEEGVWRTLQKHGCIKFIRGGEDLFCLSRVEGKDVGAPGNWDWHFIAGGGYGAAFCCLIPWHSHPDKLVLARKTPEGWSKLALFDVETKFEIENPSIAADKSGTLHVLYSAGEGGYVRDKQCAYLRIEPMTLGESSESNQSFGSDHGEAPRTLTKVSGRAVTSKGECYDIAADPETGAALITIRELHRDRYQSYRYQSYSHIVENGKIGPQVPMYNFDGVIDLEPAGEGRFLALGTWLDQGFWVRTWFIYYLEYRNGMWSAPVELGKEKGILWLRNVVLLSDLDRRAIALWTDKNDRPVARWIER